MNKFQLLEWALEYDAYKRLAYGPDRLADVVRPLSDSIKQNGKAPEWAGVDLLRGLAFCLNRQLNWPGEPKPREEEVIHQLRIIADAIDRHPDAQPKDRFNSHISLGWKKDSTSWTATVLLGGPIDEETLFEGESHPIVLYRIFEVPGGYQLWAWMGDPENGFLEDLMHMPTAYFSQLAMRMGFYPNLSGAKNSANADAIERLYMGKPA